MHFDVMERIISELPDKEKFKIAQLNRNLREKYLSLAKWLYVREKTDKLCGVSLEGLSAMSVQDLPRLTYLLLCSRNPQFLAKKTQKQPRLRKSSAGSNLLYDATIYLSFSDGGLGFCVCRSQRRRIRPRCFADCGRRLRAKTRSLSGRIRRRISAQSPERKGKN